MKRFSTVWSLVFLMVAGASGLPGQQVELVSRVDSSQISDTGASRPSASDNTFIATSSISADGRYVAFDSKAANLVPGQQDRNGTYDVFLRDVVTGTTLLVSRALGSQVKTGNAISSSPVISGDGRYVAFLTRANDLAPGQSGFVGHSPEDLLLFDRITGASILVVNSGSSPAISADGRYIAFISDERNLVPGQIGSRNNTRNIFLYDRLAGTFRLVNHTDTSATTAAEGSPGPPVLSADGRYTAFYTAEFVSGEDVATVSLYDRDSGAILRIGPGERPAMSADGRIIAFSHAGSPQIYDRVTQERSVVNASNRSHPVLSADGRFITFLSDDDHLVPGQEGDIFSGLFLYDRISQAFTLVSRYQGSATAPREASSPTISGDGRFITFTSTEPDLVPGQDNPRRFRNVFLFDRTSGQVTLVSRSSASASASGNASSYAPLINTNGSRITFFSMATDLEEDPRDFNEGQDVFVHEISSGTNLAATRRAPEKPSLSPFAESGEPVPSADGRWIAFASFSSHIVPAQEDLNDTSDVFLYDRATRTVLLVSRARRSAAARAANGRSVLPAVSADGRYVTYASKATNLVPGTAGPAQAYTVFQFDRVTGQNRLVGRTGFTAEPEFGSIPSVSISASADGRWVAFISLENNLVPGQQEPSTFQTADIFLWDRDSGTTVLVSRTNAGPAVAGNSSSFGQQISSDGRYVAFSSTANDLVPGPIGEEPGQSFFLRLFLYDRTTGGVVHVNRLDRLTPPPDDSFSMSADGRFIAFLRPGPDGAEVRLYDRTLGAQQVIEPRGTSPRISADGRYVAFMSLDSEHRRQVYLYDRASHTTLLATPSRTRNGGLSNGSASYPAISADGRYVSFLSDATDLVPGQVSARDPERREYQDVFLFDRVSNTTVLVNRLNGSPVTVTGGVRNPVLSTPPLLSASGRQVAFTGALDLVNGDLNLLSDAYVFSLDPPPSAGPIPLPPCKLLDTRRRAERPILTSNVQRAVTAHRACGVPATARQVAVNVTVFKPSDKGNLRFYPGAVTATPSGILRFERGATRTQTFVLPLGPNGTLTILPFVADRGTVHVAVEVTGYFQ